MSCFGLCNPDFLQGLSEDELHSLDTKVNEQMHSVDDILRALDSLRRTVESVSPACMEQCKTDIALIHDFVWSESVEANIQSMDVSSELFDREYPWMRSESPSEDDENESPESEDDKNESPEAEDNMSWEDSSQTSPREATREL